MNIDILDIFYNYVIKEAVNGKVSCFFDYTVIFNTYLEETNERLICKQNIPNVIIPTLKIKSREIFNELLIKYVNLCKNFYTANNFEEEVLNREEYEINRTCPEKQILTLLWSNATFDDFENPECYLRKRIAFLESNVKLEDITTDYSNYLNGNINIKILKDNIYNETPYKMVIDIKNSKGEIYSFPQIKFGIENDTVYFYAIQNINKIHYGYAKMINRLLFKIGENFDSNKDNHEIYGEGNLKDISASFLVALNIAVNYFNNLGYQKLVASSILITRWNAKKVIVNSKIKSNVFSEREALELIKKQDAIQQNLTDKFLRTFLRLDYHYPNLEVNAYPFDIDSNLHLKITGDLYSNNTLLNETGMLVKNNNKKLNL